MRVIGLMSGTSADAIDAALVEWPDGPAVRPFRLLAACEEPLERALQDRIHALAAGRLPGPEVLRALAALDVELADRFAAAAAAAARAAGVPLATVDVIASHGQTVAHHPELGASLQIGDPSRIAERTGVLTIADFRARDLAAGGEGAPLAPFFHHAVFASPDEGRLALNLGGIANVTWLPPGGDPEQVVAFDVGPANALLDGVVRRLTGERCDRDGAGARRGRVDAALLAELLDDDYLRRPPPKSTGRERYGLAEAEELADRWAGAGRSGDDLLATLVAFTATSVAHALRDFCGGTEAVARVLVGGGGARNPAVMDALREALPRAAVEPFDAAGVPADAAEAMAFALLGRNACLGLPNHLPRCTGARRAAVLGELAPAPVRRTALTRAG
ncbi:MAG: anhydro-N-acetylmuramic acid kinase [Deltaproteobacteria bacterium]|nr:anhydro-N-acetylmuramic acid kinase [Deltaproteobacteria bacterium]